MSRIRRNTSKVVVAGIRTEIYDPTFGTWAISGNMNTPRSGHVAGLLPDGTVLVVGSGGSLGSPEIFDPSTGIWARPAGIAKSRTNHTATLLQDGTVLAAGGWDSTGIGAGLPSTEIYDPTTKTWNPTGNLNTGRTNHTATLLPDGTVLVAGGGGSSGIYSLTSAERFDPTTGNWMGTGSLNSSRRDHTATLLPNGKVLVVGGRYYNGSAWVPYASAELYDPSTGSWTLASSLNQPRAGHTATLLNDGKVLVAGGLASTSTINTRNAELYDPATNTWGTAGSMGTRRSSHTATLLPNGQVEVVGGTDNSGYAIVSPELYDPVFQRWSGVD